MAIPFGLKSFDEEVARCERDVGERKDAEEQDGSISCSRSYRVFLHVVAAFVGLVVATSLAGVAIAHLLANGVTFIGVLGAVFAPVAGFEIWRHTVRLNLHRQDGRIVFRWGKPLACRFSLTRLLAYVTAYALLFAICRTPIEGLKFLVLGILVALTVRLFAEFIPITAPTRFLITILVIVLSAWTMSELQDSQPSIRDVLPLLYHSGTFYGLLVAIVVTGVLELLFGLPLYFLEQRYAHAAPGRES